ncbi:Uncharacterised protein [Legionella wadsworthii]|uniref:Uncharacterized protein n=1 Tax=Legionella wadsworthii TaxID=28088 RepID=A0A378LPU7_9GAMM|nr:hypothetical protein [Legionella wadsworthii]STY28995.1 Uncharacterised protein [Legionella wadsworthii]
MKTLFFFVASLFSFSIFAANIPQDALGAQKFDRTQCIHNTKQDCITSQCLNSDEIDCQENCQKMAESKCRQDNND